MLARGPVNEFQTQINIRLILLISLILVCVANTFYIIPQSFVIVHKYEKNTHQLVTRFHLVTHSFVLRNLWFVWVNPTFLPFQEVIKSFCKEERKYNK